LFCSRCYFTNKSIDNINFALPLLLASTTYYFCYSAAQGLLVLCTGTSLCMPPLTGIKYDGHVLAALCSPVTTCRHTLSHTSAHNHPNKYIGKYKLMTIFKLKMRIFSTLCPWGTRRGLMSISKLKMRDMCVFQLKYRHQYMGMCGLWL
jgi:hypothetical protein